MSKPDRAARVAHRIINAWLTGSKPLPDLERRLTNTIRREVKRAVEEEREAIAVYFDGCTNERCTGKNHETYCGVSIAAAIRARGRK